MNTTDTIAAPATGIGGAINIIRISGPNALTVANQVWLGKQKLSAASARIMHLGRMGGEPVLAVYMPGPKSYTGDDVVELHCHGGRSSLTAALTALWSSGARPAEAGEFTFRAFINGKMDLSKAEAVMELISSANENTRRLALHQLNGGLSTIVNGWYDRITSLRSECEARLDFPDENLDFDADVDKKIDEICSEIDKMLTTERLGDALRNGVPLVLAGAPNTGKSSLLNCLLGRDRAIVSPIPGTTRDIIEASLNLRGVPVKLLDTAGLRESTDVIEQNGVSKSRETLKSAYIIFFLIDAVSCQNIPEELHSLPQSNTVVVWNKIDLITKQESEKLPLISGFKNVKISVKNKSGMKELLDAFEEIIRPGEAGSEIPATAINARGAKNLRNSLEFLANAKKHFINEVWELAAAELADAAKELGFIVGKSASPDLLDEVFHRFCIGK